MLNLARACRIVIVSVQRDREFITNTCHEHESTDNGLNVLNG